MKQKAIICLAFGYSIALGANAQMSDSVLANSSTTTFRQAAAQYLKAMPAKGKADVEEGSEVNAYKRWIDFTDDRICTDAPEGANRIRPYSQAVNTYFAQRGAGLYCENKNGYAGDWKNIGPFNAKQSPNGGEWVSQSPNGIVENLNGRVASIWAGSSDSNYILIGAHTGGLWKTTNGGKDWKNITDGNLSNSALPGTMGVHSIAVDPINEQNIYLATGSAEFYNNGYGYATGLIKSTDGGATWAVDQQVATALNLNNGVGGHYLNKVAYMPNTQKLFGIYENHLLYKASPTSSWIDVPGGPGTGFRFMDFDFTKQSTGKVVLVTNTVNRVCNIYIYDVSLATWNVLTVSMPTAYRLQDTGIAEGISDVSVSGSDNAFMRISTVAGTVLAKTPLSAWNVKVVNSACPEFIEVSPADERVIYAGRRGGVSAYYSVNGGTSFSVWPGNYHVDPRCVYIRSSNYNTSRPGLDDVVFMGNDGGISLKKGTVRNANSINGNGLCISQITGFGTSSSGEDYLEGAAQDNGAFTYNRNKANPWEASDRQGDNYTSRFARNGVNTVYSAVYWPLMSKLDFTPVGNSEEALQEPLDYLPPGTEDWSPETNQMRPLYFAPDNTAHIGVYRTLRKTLTMADWKETYISDPKNAPMNPGARKPVKFIIPEKAGFSNVAYIAYRYEGADSINHDPTGPNNDLGRLYVSTSIIQSGDARLSNSFNGTTRWTNITPGVVGWWRINDIEIDPENPARIWVAIGGIEWSKLSTAPSQMEHRMMYSPNYGRTWTDVSKGLPAVPISKVIYQKGTDDILYAATDVGMFIWNKTDNQWCSFNKGFPSCIVTDMEINYCAGKLRVSTFGRGIWECNIMNESNYDKPETGDFVPNQTVIISANTTWNSDKYIETGVRVKAGAILTINNTGSVQTVIHMPKNGAIVVEQGGTIVIDGAKITHDCGGFWKGILVLGYPYQPQIVYANVQVANQGYAILKNGAVIENARAGLVNAGESLPINWAGSAGGVIQADDALFYNNSRSAVFYPYHNKTDNKVIANNKSYFKKCKFLGSVDRK